MKLKTVVELLNKLRDVVDDDTEVSVYAVDVFSNEETRSDIIEIGVNDSNELFIKTL